MTSEWMPVLPRCPKLATKLAPRESCPPTVVLARASLLDTSKFSAPSALAAGDPSDCGRDAFHDCREGSHAGFLHGVRPPRMMPTAASQGSKGPEARPQDRQEPAGQGPQAGSAGASLHLPVGDGLQGCV